MSELLKINVNEHTEKKNGLTYLTWAWAWAEVLKIDPLARWEAHEFTYNGEFGPALLPFMVMPDGSAMVKVSVTIKGDTKTCLLPVMDHRNKAIKNPDAFAVNTAVMRCMTKAIGMHGLGLYIYAGEDLPQGEEPEKKTDPIPESFRSSATMGALESLAEDERDYIREMAADVTVLAPAAAVHRIEAESLDDTQKMALWSLLDSKTRAAIKKAQQEMRQKEPA